MKDSRKVVVLYLDRELPISRLTVVSLLTYIIDKCEKTVFKLTLIFLISSILPIKINIKFSHQNIISRRKKVIQKNFAKNGKFSLQKETENFLFCPAIEAKFPLKFPEREYFEARHVWPVLGGALRRHKFSKRDS